MGIRTLAPIKGKNYRSGGDLTLRCVLLLGVTASPSASAIDINQHKETIELATIQSLNVNLVKNSESLLVFQGCLFLWFSLQIKVYLSTWSKFHSNPHLDHHHLDHHHHHHHLDHHHHHHHHHLDHHLNKLLKVHWTRAISISILKFKSIQIWSNLIQRLVEKPSSPE